MYIELEPAIYHHSYHSYQLLSYRVLPEFKRLISDGHAYLWVSSASTVQHRRTSTARITVIVQLLTRSR